MKIKHLVFQMLSKVNWSVLCLIFVIVVTGAAGEKKIQPIIPKLTSEVSLPDHSQEKLLWAHYVGWGFNQTEGYDTIYESNRWRMNPFNDRSLLGRDIQTDQGIYFAARKQIDSARQYGFDGFCIDLITPQGYSSGMSRFYKAAEASNFKIALCMDNLRADSEQLFAGLRDFLTTYGRHPNNAYINNLPVIFIYNLAGKTPDEWNKIRQHLSESDLDAYYIGQPMRETTLWDNPEKMQTALTMVNGLYDFGINGFTRKEMDTRLSNGRKALVQLNRSDLLVAGITTGYIGNSSAFYRPFQNIRTVRDTWQSAIANTADWVCVTTWNDYVEHTQFEPSAVNRDVLLRINRAYAAQWRNDKLPLCPPVVSLNYHEEIVFGDDFTLDYTCLPYNTEAVQLHIRLCDLSGKSLYSYPPQLLDNKEITVQTLRITHQDMSDNWRFFRVQAALSQPDTAEDQLFWREAYPVARRLGRMESVRTVRIPLTELARTPINLQIRNNSAGQLARIVIDSWIAAGRIELVKNGWPVAEAIVSHRGKPQFVWEVQLQQFSSEDFYVVRFNNVSDEVVYSNPALVVDKSFVNSEVVAQPVIVTGADFDENWPIWSRRQSRLANKQIVNCMVSPAAVFALIYRCDAGEGDFLQSSSAWKYPAALNAKLRFGNKPQADQKQLSPWLEVHDFSAQKRFVLFFNGINSCIALPSRSMPYGPFVLEFWLKPESTGQEMTVFYDRNQAAIVKLNTQLYPTLRRGESPEIIADSALIANKWHHLAAAYDGQKLYLYLDGKLVASEQHKPYTIGINSLPVIGTSGDYSAPYHGQLGGFSLTGGFYQPDQFVLTKMD